MNTCLGQRARRSATLTASLLALALVATACGGGAEESSADAAENLTGQELVAAAKEQCDSLTWYGANEPEWMERVAKSFEQEYGIRVEWAEANSGELTSRVMTETQTGGTKADVITVPLSVMAGFADHDILRPYNAANIGKIDKTIVESSGEYGKYFTPIQLDSVGIIYNTNKVSADEAPKSWKDLAEARWKGQLAAPSPEASLLYASTIDFLSETHGWDFVDQVASDLQLTRGSGDSQALILTGEKSVVAYAAFSVAAFALQKNKDTPMALVAPEEGLLTSAFGSAVTAASKCTHGAQLLINYTSEEKVQAWVPEYGYYPTLPGVPGPKALPALNDIKWQPLKWQEVANPDRHKEIIGRFSQAAGK